jgi:hypothetical protein
MQYAQSPLQIKYCLRKLILCVWCVCGACVCVYMKVSRSLKKIVLHCHGRDSVCSLTVMGGGLLTTASDEGQSSEMLHYVVW